MSNPLLSFCALIYPRVRLSQTQVSAVVQCLLYHSQSTPGPGTFLTVRGLVNDLTTGSQNKYSIPYCLYGFFSFHDKFASDLVHYFNLLALQFFAVFFPLKVMSQTKSKENILVPNYEQTG